MAVVLPRANLNEQVYATLRGRILARQHGPGEKLSLHELAATVDNRLHFGDIDLDQGGEEVFKAGLSLIWKSLVVNRIYDRKNNTLIYLIHSREVVDGSAKMAISTVPLYNQQVTWTEGKPEE